MSMAHIDPAPRALMTFLATVDFPEPEPPAMPMINGAVMRQDWRESCRGCRSRRSGPSVTIRYHCKVTSQLLAFNHETTCGLVGWWVGGFGGWLREAGFSSRPPALSPSRPVSRAC